jgi:NADH-quinone oxidoreductase subunit I
MTTRRGVLGLDPAACTVCMLCVRDCPDWCITIEGHQERVAPEGGGRSRLVNVLDAFTIDFGLCMYCGICVEVCPHDALRWAPAVDYPAADADGLVHDLPQLAAWWPGRDAFER